MKLKVGDKIMFHSTNDRRIYTVAEIDLSRKVGGQVFLEWFDDKPYSSWYGVYESINFDIFVDNIIIVEKGLNISPFKQIKKFSL